MVKYGVVFEVRTESLNIIWTSFGFKKFNFCESVTHAVTGSKLYEIWAYIFDKCTNTITPVATFTCERLKSK
jgi:hypothetical protein